MSKAIDELREHFNQRPVPSSKVLVEERDMVNAMIDAVEAENSNLRKAAEFEHNQLQDIKRAVDMVLEEYNAMLVENARLRELCKDLYMCTDDTCNDCKHRNLTGDGFYCKFGIGWRARRMREMGIEVDYDKD